MRLILATSFKGLILLWLAIICACSHIETHVAHDTGCVLDLDSFLLQTDKMFDAFRYGYNRTTEDPKRLYLVATVVSDSVNDLIVRPNIMNTIAHSENINCKYIVAPDSVYLSQHVTLEDYMQHMTSVHDRIVASPDTALILAVFNSGNNLEYIYVGGGVHDVQLYPINE